jgi:UDPglucose 6-dehydrogenase
MENAKKIFGNKVEFADDMYDMLKGVDALAILTEWAEFRTPDFEKIASLMKSKIIFDGRNLYGLDQLREAGFYYNSIGRESVGS